MAIANGDPFPLDEYKTEDFYSILNVSRNATPQQIRTAFHRLSLRFHPDKTRAADGRDVFARIQRAYEVLMTPAQRKIYDMYGESGLQQLVLRPRGKEDFEREWQELARQEDQNRLESLVGSRGNISLGFQAGIRPSPWLMLASLHISHAFNLPIQLGLPSTLVGPDFPSPTTLELSAEAATSFSAVPTMPAVQLQLRHAYSPALSFAVGVSPLSRDWFAISHWIDSSTSRMVQLELHSGAPVVHLSTRFNSSSYCFSKFDTNGVAVGLRGNNWSLETGALYIKATYKRVRRSMTFRLATTMMPGGYSFGFGLSRKFGNARAGIGWGMGAGGFRMNLSWSRLGQKISLPIAFVDHPDTQEIGFLVLAPLTSLFLMYQFVIKPRRQRIKGKENAVRREQVKKIAEERRKEAESTMEVIRETLLASQQAQRKWGGLFIHSATYQAVSKQKDLPVADVTLAVMALVDRNQLLIGSGYPKYRILGFYDPAPFEKKVLVIEYEYRGRRARIQVGDEEGVTIPMRSHELPS